MNNGIIMVLIIMVVVAVTIYFVKNNKEIFEKIKFCKEKRVFKISISILLIILICGYLYILVKNAKDVNNNLEALKLFNQNNEMFDICDEEIEKENETYSYYIQQKYEDNYDSPYILNGFSYVDGSWDTGFVIEDERENQFVWVPVSNIEKDNVPKLIKENFIINPLINKEYCLDDNYEAFFKSALENGGFYISRYEIGLEDENVVSKAEKELLSNLTQEEVKLKINKMYETNEFTYELINGYAYDTTIEWIKKNTKIKTFEIDMDNKVLTGRNSIKNVFDMFDNVFEYTR